VSKCVIVIGAFADIVVEGLHKIFEIKINKSRNAGLCIYLIARKY
jgi:hypothetical protein